MASKNTWRFLFIAELLLLALPLSFIDAVAVVTTLFDIFSPTKNYPAWASWGLTVLIALATASLISGWTLALRFLWGGAQSLANSHWLLWLFCSLGGLISIAALASYAFPLTASTRLWYFRDTSSALILGLLLFIPFAHLLVERFRLGR